MKWLFFALMLLIFFNLFRGFYFLMKEGGQNSTKVLRSLAMRVALTIFFFVSLYVADYFDLIDGHGLRQGLEAESLEQAQ